MIEVGKTYLSGNPALPHQMFTVTNIEEHTRFGKPNVLVKFDQFARIRNKWRRIDKCHFWYKEEHFKQEVADDEWDLVWMMSITGTLKS